MYELIQLTERTYYIKSPTNIGLFRLDEKNVCLIDSGNDKDAGRRIRQVLASARRLQHPFQRRPHRREPVFAGTDGL